MPKWVLAWCLFCAACSGVLGFTAITPPPDAPTICFSDPFDAAVIDPDRWTVSEIAGGTSVAATGGQLVFTLAQTVSYADLQSFQLDFEDGAIEIELVQAPIEDGHEETGLELAANSSDAYTFYSANGNLNFRERMSGQPDIETTIQYSATLHRYLRIRHETAGGPTVHFETSMDRTTWKEHASVPANVPVSTASARVYSGTYAAPGPASTAVYDDFQITGACPPPP